MKLQILINDLIENLKSYGILESSIDSYRNSCRRLARFAETMNTVEYSTDLLEKYSLHIDNQLENEVIKPDYYQFQARVIRLLRSLAETGKADFSPVKPRHEKYPVSEEDHTVIDRILDSSHLTASVRVHLSAPIRHFFWYANENGHSIHTIDDTIVMSFLVSEAPRSNPGSMGDVLRGIKLSTAYMKKNGIGSLMHDYAQLKSRSEPSRLIPAFSEEEVNGIVKAADTGTALGVRNYAIILLAYGTGLRGIDIVQLKLSDIDWRNGNAKICQSKTVSPLIVELNGTIMNAIADYILTKRPTCTVPEVFVTVTAPYRKLTSGFAKMIDRYCAVANIPKIPLRAFHSLRRAFETTLVSGGVPLETVSAMAGHKGIESDKPYLTFDRSKTAFISMDFSDVPITAGIYAGLFRKSVARKEAASK